MVQTIQFLIVKLSPLPILIPIWAEIFHKVSTFRIHFIIFKIMLLNGDVFAVWHIGLQDALSILSCR